MQCFVGREAVAAMLEHDLCLHRDHGVMLCREMEREGIIHHVLYEDGARQFGDDGNALYQWAVDDELDGKDVDLDVAFGVVEEVETAKLAAVSGPEMEALPPFTKLPAALLEMLDLSGLESAKKRHRSTLSRFKQTADHFVDLPVLRYFVRTHSVDWL